MATEKRGMPVGCWVAIVVTLVVVLGCGGLFAVMGWAAWNNPGVQRAVSIGGAAFQLVQDAQNAPGAAELRREGCVQAMVMTPEILERFAETLDVDGGVQDLPDVPIVSCNARADSTLTCNSLASTYFSAVDPPPAEVAITLQIQGENRARCQGIYDAQGDMVREFGSQERQFGGIQPGQPPPP